MNIILTGFMGSGKTSVGRALSKKLGFKFVDTDELIVEHESCSINDIFAEHGEVYFRDIETEIAHQVSKMDNCVVSTGGGIVLKKENMDILAKNGIIVYLAANPNIIFERIKDDTSRPLLQVDDPKARIKELLDARAKFYDRNDFSIDTSSLNIEEIVELLEEKIKLISDDKKRNWL